MSDIVELRRYTLRPGQRDVLIELFDREFVETQEATGMRILGQFRDLGDPDQFVWVRSFPDMAVRKSALTDFYSGPAWKAHAAAANATMIDVDNVLLLHPAGQRGDFQLDPAARDTPASSQVVATIYDLPEPVDDALVGFFETTVIPLLEKAGATPFGLMQTEYADNDFPGLPIRTGVHKLVSFTSYPSSTTPADIGAKLAAMAEWVDTVAGRLPEAEQLILTPTDRSLLR
ncbi:MAG TPA: NIPSNAP family protein [Pseudonocardiaceae bacterium]|nr:NIPSNAP family protein [Pseudonocardiaceae bacterium]